VTASQAGDVCITCCLCRRLCHRHRASLTSSCPEQSLSIPIQPGNCHDRSLSSESITLSPAHLLGLFREFRHYILPCQHDGHSKPASVLLFKVSWWQLDLCKSHLGRYARSRQVSIQQIRVHATDDRTRSLWTPFSESPSHGIRSRYYLFRVCTNPFMLLFGTVLPCFLHGSRMWLDWCASIITDRILHYPQFVSMSVPCFQPIGHPTTKGSLPSCQGKLGVWVYAE
jgi:hypothetical protein